MLDKKGQSTVEYVLLLGVIGLIFFAAFKNPILQGLIGPDGTLFQGYSSYVEYTYRHGLPGNGNTGENYGSSHPSYSPSGNNTRFFTPVEQYP